MKNITSLFIISMFMIAGLAGQTSDTTFQKDLIETTAGPLEITFVGHGSLMFAWDGKIIHIDPSSREADYSLFPDADLVLITHHHGDHLDNKALAEIVTEETKTIASCSCAERLAEADILKNGDKGDYLSLNIEAVPAYNLVHKRSSGTPFHVPGEGNGYIVTIGDTRIYIAGDTENIPEMKALQAIDIAFLPMNLPYTMTPEMVADAARVFRPKVFYPYHYGSTDTSLLVNLLEGESDIEVRIRKM